MFGGQIPHPPPIFKRKNRVEISKFRREHYASLISNLVNMFYFCKI